ncbi:MAG TPA: hypothetical protein VJR25_09415 [Microbacterium sp.]|uniref:hypothetical protein n=1 Tax=Microbacterium sp. TaxID=51671 RepID=UPI002B48FEAC|nr:hypothetical protein [Microbacterium sp.]HKT56979.1 hypothetical protein [Microbacterium sp.]
MNDLLWSDDEFRSFFALLRRDSCTSCLDDTDRAGFVQQARLRVAPTVQRRLLADIGIAADASGIAVVALDVLGDEVWGKRGTWLMITPEPWALLADLVARRIRRSYRASTRRAADERVLRGIERAGTADGLTG